MKTKDTAIAETATSQPKAGGKAHTKRTYAARWRTCTRTVDNWLKSGLPHLKIGQRMVRINQTEGDAWLRERFGQQRFTTKPHPDQSAKTRFQRGAATKKQNKRKEEA